MQGPAHLLPTKRYLELELRRHVLRNIAHFRLHAHILRVETGCWQIHNRHSMTNVTCMMSRTKDVSFFMPLLRNVLLEKEIHKQFADFTADRNYIRDTGAFTLTTSVLMM